jgi:TPR repeat protein
VWGRILKVSTFLVVAGLICLLVNFNFPSQGEACGWWGDGQHDDDVEDDWEGAEGTSIPDEMDSPDDPENQTRIGNRHREGNGVSKNYTKAVYWYRKAAEQGFAGAQNNLAFMYEQGFGVPKDESEAAKWYRRAAVQKDAYAQHSLGRMYRDGRGVPQDLAEAAKWFREAAKQGHDAAFRDMGEMYWKGSGLSQNNVLAYMWWKLGALHGDKESDRLRSMAAIEMTPSYVTEAEELAKQWMSKNR